jgi:hypothetical protein
LNLPPLRPLARNAAPGGSLPASRPAPVDGYAAGCGCRQRRPYWAFLHNCRQSASGANRRLKLVALVSNQQTNEQKNGWPGAYLFIQIKIASCNFYPPAAAGAWSRLASRKASHLERHILSVFQFQIKNIFNLKLELDEVRAAP